MSHASRVLAQESVSIHDSPAAGSSSCQLLNRPLLLAMSREINLSFPQLPTPTLGRQVTLKRLQLRTCPVSGSGAAQSFISSDSPTQQLWSCQPGAGLVSACLALSLFMMEPRSVGWRSLPERRVESCSSPGVEEEKRRLRKPRFQGAGRLRLRTPCWASGEVMGDFTACEATTPSQGSKLPALVPLSHWALLKNHKFKYKMNNYKISRQQLQSIELSSELSPSAKAHVSEAGPS